MDIKDVRYLAVVLAIFYVMCAVLSPLMNTGIQKAPIPSPGSQGGNTELARNASSAQRPMKTILFWTAYFGDKNWNGVFHREKNKIIQCDSPCLLSRDRKNPLAFDALIFHGRDRQQPPKMRRPGQVYIMHLMESPYHRGVSIKGGSFYNWTATYHHKSDVFMPWFNVTKRESHTHSLALPELPQLTYKRQTEEAMVFWVVSNCKTIGKREVYVETLKRYLKVDIFGRCHGKRCPDSKIDCKEHYAKTGKYKFYLGFENSACKDYISEKSYTGLKINMVPIVYGGMAIQDHVDLLPPNSFINVRDFTSPKHLADYLLYLDKNTTAYMEYFKWRQNYEILKVDRYCVICNALHTKSKIKESNVDFGRFWNPETQCDNNLIRKVMK